MMTGKVLYLGDRPLGYNCLSYLIDHLDMDRICGVGSISQNQKMWWGYSPIQQYCNSLGIPWYDTEVFNIEKIVEETNPDILIGILYPKIVPKKIIDSIRCINLHCAPLPKYKGYNSSLWAIINGEKQFGVTLHEMAEKSDSGPIIGRKIFDVPSDITNIELYTMAHDAAYELFKMYTKKIIDGTYILKPQARDGTYYYKKSQIPDRCIQLSWEEEKIDRYVRAFYFPPFEPAYIYVQGEKIWMIPEWT